ncbi:hypothetical protein BKA70DRAFT_1121355, partial [Coprinopsis sp. MPI-PUGE-AT-0042]
MTDYASQGKTRKINVVDLAQCKNHQSYYTCLSRSASAADTVILQGFDTTKITKGVHGFLRQEFRELDLLDAITQHRFDDTLPGHIWGNLRNPMIRAFQLWKKEIGDKSHEDLWHPAQRWTKSLDDNEIRKSKSNDATWDSTVLQSYKILKKKRNRAKTHAVALSDLARFTSIATNKRPLDNSQIEENASNHAVAKRAKTTVVSTALRPAGFAWDAVNWSCSYDAVLSLV